MHLEVQKWVCKCMDKPATFSFTIYDLGLCHTVLGFCSVLLFRKWCSVLRVSVIAGLDYWTGLLDCHNFMHSE